MDLKQELYGMKVHTNQLHYGPVQMKKLRTTTVRIIELIMILLNIIFSEAGEKKAGYNKNKPHKAIKL